ncbi:hypothetical protein D3C86_1896150 [compost metagenome]
MKVAGPIRSCNARWMHPAGFAAISTPWPRRWKTSCAMPFVIRRREALSSWAASVMAISGTCGWKITAAVLQKLIWSGSSCRSPASTVRGRGMVDSD